VCVCARAPPNNNNSDTQMAACHASVISGIEQGGRERSRVLVYLQFRGGESGAAALAIPASSVPAKYVSHQTAGDGREWKGRGSACALLELKLHNGTLTRSVIVMIASTFSTLIPPKALRCSLVIAALEMGPRDGGSAH